MDLNCNKIPKIIKVDTLPNAMSLFRKSNKKCECYYIITLGKRISMTLNRNRITFGEPI